MQQTKGMGLRLGGVYALPNGTRLIVGVGRGVRFFLYNPYVWKETGWILNMPVEYEVDAEGNVVTGTGYSTSWRIEDLIDTEQIVEREI